MSSAAHYKWLSITRALPSLGPSHHPSSHSELAFDTNGITERLWPCVRPLLPKLPKHYTPAMLASLLFWACMPSVFPPWDFCTAGSLYLKCYSPVILHAGSLTSKCQHTDTVPHYLPFLFLYPALNLSITFVPHQICCNFVSWHVVDAQWICEEWINEKLNSIPHFLTASAVYSHRFKDMECNR